MSPHTTLVPTEVELPLTPGVMTLMQARKLEKTVSLVPVQTAVTSWVAFGSEQTAQDV
jgi:hypothetical protein